MRGSVLSLAEGCAIVCLSAVVRVGLPARHQPSAGLATADARADRRRAGARRRAVSRRRTEPAAAQRRGGSPRRHRCARSYVDFTNRLILVREAFVLGEDEYTKTDGLQRDIQMTQVVYEALQRQQQATGRLSDYVFCNREGRVTSTVQAFDAQRRQMRTRSGRLYELRGSAGCNGNAQYVWECWCEANAVACNDSHRRGRAGAGRGERSRALMGWRPALRCAGLLRRTLQAVWRSP